MARRRSSPAGCEQNRIRHTSGRAMRAPRCEMQSALSHSVSREPNRAAKMG